MVSIDFKKHISICKIRPGKIPFFLSKALSNIPTTPLIDWHEKMSLWMSLKSFKAPLETLLSFSACSVTESVIPVTRALTVVLPRARITLIITNQTSILFDKCTCWPQFQIMLCAHGSMRCMFLYQVCRVHSCLWSVVPYVAVSQHLPPQHS